MRSYVNRSSTSVSTTSKIISEDILLEGFDGEGNHLFSKKIYRDVVEKGPFKLFSDQNIYFNEKGIHVCYNTTAERISGKPNQHFRLRIKVKVIDLIKCLIEESIKIYNNERPH